MTQELSGSSPQSPPREGKGALMRTYSVAAVCYCINVSIIVLGFTLVEIWGV